MATRTIHRCSFPVGDTPPSEFRVFAMGEIETTKGTFTLDEEGARALIAAYVKHGADVMIDLDHQSLDYLPSPDPTARDARGWCQLEMRADGIWAVNVRWTPDGAERLRDRRQRYISPAFLTDESGRIIELVNIALCALPATHGLDALIAATEKRRIVTMTPEQMMQLAIALGLSETATVEEVIAAVSEFQCKLEAAVNGEDAADATDPTAEDPNASPPPAPGGEMMAATDRDALREILALTSRGSLSDALRDVREWHATHQATEARAEKLDRIEREALGVRMVKAGARPATVWSDAFAKPGERTLRKHLAGLTLAELREEAEALEGGRSRPADPPRREPRPTGASTVALTDRQRAIAKQYGISEEKYAERLARDPNQQKFAPVGA